MYSFQLIDTFQLEDNVILNQDIHAVPAVQPNILVYYRQRMLVYLEVDTVQA